MFISQLTQKLAHHSCYPVPQGLGGNGEQKLEHHAEVLLIENQLGKYLLGVSISFERPKMYLRNVSEDWHRLSTYCNRVSDLRHLV